jgi:hypothetical protein
MNVTIVKQYYVYTLLHSGESMKKTVISEYKTAEELGQSIWYSTPNIFLVEVQEYVGEFDPEFEETEWVSNHFVRNVPDGYCR